MYLWAAKLKINGVIHEKILCHPCTCKYATFEYQKKNNAWRMKDFVVVEEESYRSCDECGFSLTYVTNPLIVWIEKKD